MKRPAAALAERSARTGRPAVIHGGPRLRAALALLAEHAEETKARAVYRGLDQDDGTPWTVEVYSTANAERARRAELGEDSGPHGGFRPGAGRKKGSLDKAPRTSLGLTEVVRMRCSPGTKDLIRALALKGESDSDVLRAGLVLLASARGKTFDP